MAKDRPPLAKSELEIVRIVWQLGEATVREVHEALPKERELDFWTVQTYLRRLRDKGYLEATRRGQGNVYTPAVQPGTVIGGIECGCYHAVAAPEYAGHTGPARCLYFSFQNENCSADFFHF